MSNHQIKAEKKPKIEIVKSKSFLMRPIPLYFFLILLLPIILLFYSFHQPKRNKPYDATEINQMADNNDCSVIIRQKDTGLIKPLLFVESYRNEESYKPLKLKIDNYLKQKSQDGSISTASVYMNDLTTANHFEINPQELYDPASLIKVSLMIVYLKEAETNPSTLKKKIFFSSKYDEDYAATIKDVTISVGKQYSVSELLYHMIVYSDNEAFWLLIDNSDASAITKLNESFGIPINTDKIHNRKIAPNFVANANSISRFFRVLYSATYLNREMSQYALSLLTQSKYKEGLLKGVEKNIK